MRIIQDKLRQKYKTAQAELKDIRGEHQGQKEELLDIVRSQEKAVKFSNKVMSILLSENELYKLHEKSKWDDEKEEWKIPFFAFNPKSKDLSFPTINAKQRVEQVKDERELFIDDNKTAKKEETTFDAKKPSAFGGQLSQKNSLEASSKRKKDSDDYNSVGQMNHEILSTGGNYTNERGFDNHSALNGKSKKTGKISNQNTTSKNHNLGDGIIPERRRKYLGDEHHTSINDIDHSDAKKNLVKKQIHLAPLDKTRNSSVPPLQLGQVQAIKNPLNFAPMGS